MLSLPHFVHPDSGAPLLFGRRRPAGGFQPHPGLMRWNLLDLFRRTPLPGAPSWFDYTRASATAPLYPGMSDPLLNDALSDCTSAGALKITESWVNRAGQACPLGPADALKFYELSTGYDPANPASDQGGIETEVLAYWRDHGLDGQGAHRIAGYMPVHPGDVATMRSLCWLTGNLYFGVDLPTSWTARAPQAGFVWGADAPNPDQGHCFVGLGADDQGILVMSWGLVGTMTYDAIARLCDPSAGGQLFCVLSTEDLAAARASIPGIDWATLVSDFDSQGGSVRA